MSPLAVIECFNVSDDRACDFFASGVIAVMHFLHFQRMPKTFHRCVVIAVTGAAHGLPHAVTVEHSAKCEACGLTTAIGMKYQFGLLAWMLSKPRYTQRIDDELLRHS